MKYSIVILLALSTTLLPGCSREKKAVPAEAEKKNVEISDIEPFLVPEVVKVEGEDGVAGEKAAVRDLVINYNREAIISQVRIGNLENLRELADKKEFIRMNASIEKDRVDGMIMSSTLRNLRFDKISLNKDTGTVKTTEDWYFEDRDLKTGKVVTPFKDMEYKVEYKVIKKDGKWVISGLELKKAAEYMPPRGTPKRTTVKHAE